MASSNRHWPSLFKSKPCSSHHHHQWQHDMNHSPLLASGACQKPIYSSSGVAEERSPEPKPRWNPKPEQIRILEAIFNSGMVNPPRDEIRKIRAQLQEFGQVGDANVFYWFQNRKSRSKHKQRQLQSARSQARTTAAAASTAQSHCAAAAGTATSVAGPTSSSSSSSGSGASDKFRPFVSIGPAAMTEAPLSGPMAVSVNETAPFHGQALPPNEFLVEPFYLQGTHAFSFSSAIAGYPEPFGVSMGSPAAIWSDLMLGQEKGSKIMNAGGVLTEEPKAYNKLHNPNPSFVAGGLVPAASVGGGVAATSPAVTAASVGFPAGPISETQAEAAAAGIGGVGGAARSIVFINEAAFEVVSGPLNIREAFGEEAILIHSSGHAVLTDQWGLTLHPLQHGASYYLV